jgi:rhodanese-related sulfurtransferase
MGARGHFRGSLLPLLVLAIVWAACAKESGDKGPAVRELNPVAASALLREHAADPSFVVLDVRTPAEFRREKIAGARNVDFHTPAFREALGALDRNATYLVYCRTGNRSAKTLPILRELGFRNVLHLTDGITAWKSAGLPVEIGPDAP